MNNEELNIEKNDEAILKESITKAAKNLTPEEVDQVIGGLTSTQRRIIGALVLTGAAGAAGCYVGKRMGSSTVPTQSVTPRQTTPPPQSPNYVTCSVSDICSEYGIEVSDQRKKEMADAIETMKGTLVKNGNDFSLVVDGFGPFEGKARFRVTKDAINTMATAPRL